MSVEHEERKQGEDETVEQEEARPEETTSSDQEGETGVNPEEQGYGGQAE